VSASGFLHPFPEGEIDWSCDGSVGETIVKEDDLKGNMASLGLPARSDIKSGLFSNGNTSQTESTPLSRDHRKYPTTECSFSGSFEQKIIVEICWKLDNLIKSTSFSPEC
jgi:hypothetical protein